MGISDGVRIMFYLLNIHRSFVKSLLGQNMAICLGYPPTDIDPAKQRLWNYCPPYSHFIIWVSQFLPLNSWLDTGVSKVITIVVSIQRIMVIHWSMTTGWCFQGHRGIPMAKRTQTDTSTFISQPWTSYFWPLGITMYSWKQPGGTQVKKCWSVMMTLDATPGFMKNRVPFCPDASATFQAPLALSQALIAQLKEILGWQPWKTHGKTRFLPGKNGDWKQDLWLMSFPWEAIWCHFGIGLSRFGNYHLSSLTCCFQGVVSSPSMKINGNLGHPWWENQVLEPRTKLGIENRIYGFLMAKLTHV